MKHCKLLLVLLSLGLTACASSKLELELALYKEDPNDFRILSAPQLSETRRSLQTLHDESLVVANSRQQLANTYYQVLEKYNYLDAKSRDNGFTEAMNVEEMSGVRKPKNQFIERIGQLKKNISSAKQQAFDTIDEYGSLLKSSTATTSTAQSLKKLNSVLYHQIDDVKILALELSRPLNTGFEADLPIYWSSFSTPEGLALISAQINAGSVEDDVVASLIDEIVALGSQLGKVSMNDSASEEERKSLVKSIESVQKNVDSLIPEVTSYKPVIQVDASLEGKKAVVNARDIQETLTSNLDRIQNPADPVWRIVTDPENEIKWNTEFSRTYFWAEGNSSVVIARDSPISYRVQQGKNNPAALVKAQLQVSRAIGDAAISLAGAQFGKNSSQKADPATPDMTVGEEMAGLEARLRAEGSQRKLQIERLRQELRLIRQQLEALELKQMENENGAKDSIVTKTVQDKIDETLRQLIVKLQASHAEFGTSTN